MKTETFRYASGAAEAGGFSTPPHSFRSLAAPDLKSLVSFYLQLDFDGRRHRFCGAISDASIKRHCDGLSLNRSVVLGCFDTACLTATIELHPLFNDWEEAELAVAARHSSHTASTLGHLLQLAAFVAGDRGCRTLIIPFNSREHRLIELLRGMGRVRVHDDGARVDISEYALSRIRRQPQQHTAHGIIASSRME